MGKRFVIIGAAAAGIGAIHKLRQLDPTAQITCISSEKEFPYNKCVLTDYCLGEKTVEQITLFTPEIAGQKNIDLLLGVRVVRIEPESRQLLTDDGVWHAYDAVLLATGASPAILPIEGLSPELLFYFYNMRDADRLVAFLQQKPKAIIAVIGAGLTGIECADVIHRHAGNVIIVERASHVIPGCMDEQGAQFIQKQLRAKGVRIETSCSIVGAHQEEQVMLHTAEGKSIVVDAVVFAVGMKPNNQLAREAGLELHALGGIAVDEYLRTSNEYIFAAGDVVCVPNQFNGTMMRSCMWPDAMQQGMVAAQNMAGVVKKYGGAQPVASSSFFGLSCTAAGLFQEIPPSYVRLAYHDEHRYGCIILDGSIVKGFVLVADTSKSALLRRLLLTREPFPADHFGEYVQEGGV